MHDPNCWHKTILQALTNWIHVEKNVFHLTTRCAKWHDLTCAIWNNRNFVNFNFTSFYQFVLSTHWQHKIKDPGLARRCQPSGVFTRAKKDGVGTLNEIAGKCAFQKSWVISNNVCSSCFNLKTMTMMIVFTLFNLIDLHLCVCVYPFLSACLSVRTITWCIISSQSVQKKI